MINNQETVFTFSKGMNQDLDPSLRTQDMYYSARNLRLSTNNKPGTSQSLQNSISTKIANSEQLFDEGFIICGSVVIRDNLILFLTDSSSSDPITYESNSQIWKCSIVDYGELTDFVKLYDDSGVTADNSKLYLSTYYPITGIGRYETSNIINIYFVDGFNNFRHFNAANYLTESGGSYNATTNKYIPANMFEPIVDCEFTKPIIEDVITGSLQSGSILYAYQFYTDDGAKSNVSPFTNPISITSSVSDLDTDFKVKGNNQDEDCGKGYKLKINNNNNYFSRIKLIAVHFNTFDGTPIVRVANERYISKNETEIYITDTGETLEELTLSEVTLDNSSIFKAHAIESKDNRLFLGNIEYEVFDIDYDARAYRFASNTADQTNSTIRGRSRIYNSEGWYYQSSVGDGSLTWTLYNDLDELQGTINSWDDIPETFDCINPYNDLDNDTDTDYRYIYQENGTTLGGSGTNISYKFDLTGVQLNKINDLGRIETELSTDEDNVSYKGYSSESIQEQNKGFAREETYRMGIVFYNKKGISSYVKWIGDIRMPNINDETDEYFSIGSVTDINYFKIIHAEGYPTTTETYASVLGINFTINVPSEADAYQIVRVKRETSDRSILTQGLVLPTEVDVDEDIDIPSLWGNAASGTETNLRFISPEISFNKNIGFRPNDYLEVYAKFPSTPGTYVTMYDLPSAPSYNYEIFTVENTTTPNINVPKYGVNSHQQHFMSDGVIIEQTDTITLVNGRNCRNFKNNAPNFYGGTSLYFDSPLAGASTWLPVITGSAFDGNSNYYIASYKRNVYVSQYGGNTYEDRTNNVYIASSDIYKSTTTTFSTFQGDIFINYHTAASLIVDLTKHANGDTTAHQTVQFPVETSINTTLQSGYNMATVSPSSTNIQMVQEVAGDWEDAGILTLPQTEDMYVYNTAYSQDNTVKSFIPRPLIYTEEYKFDTRIINSNSKINGEVIDSWLKFDTNDFIDVDSRYYQINNLKEFNNKLYFWQDSAFGIASVNQRSLISDGEEGGLQLGTGGVLDRFDYISDQVGNVNKHGIGKTIKGLYWVDNNTNELYNYYTSLNPLGTIKGMKTYLDNLLVIQDVKIGCDDKNKEVLITIKGESNNVDTLVFDETLSVFSSFYDLEPSLYIETKSSLLSVKPNTHFIHTHSLGDVPGYLHGTQFDSTLSILANDKYLNTKVFDNLKWFTTVVNDDNINVFSDTWDRLRIYNDYQNSGWRTLVYKNENVSLDSDHPYERREREFTCTIPRNAIDKNVEDNPDIFNNDNIDVTQSFKERIRDKYAMIEFKYDNANDFSVNYVVVKYRISYR